MMNVLVMTQIRENYGAHDWDGTGECPQMWKCKGGEDYIIEGAPSVEDAEELAPVRIDWTERFLSKWCRGGWNWLSAPLTKEIPAGF